MRDGEDEASAAGVEAIRAELRRLRSSLARVEAEVARLPQRPPRPRSLERPERYYRVLVGVYERGGRHGLEPEALGALGAEHGYDRRGLGGFFAGTRAPLQLAAGRARLTAEGLRLVDRFLEEVAR